MTRRLCGRLLIVGLLAGTAPACFSTSAKKHVQKDRLEVADTSASMPFAPQVASPYGQMPTPSPIPFAQASRAPLPERSPVATETPTDAPTLTLVEPGSAQAHQNSDSTTQRPGKPAATALIANKPGTDDQPHILPVAYPKDEPSLVQALRCYVENRHPEAIRYLGGLDAENQEILLSLLPLTVRMAQGGLKQASPQEIAVVVDQLQGLVLALRPYAALAMDKLCFCRDARKFGAYEPLESAPTFRPGDRIDLYYEIRNVSCGRASSEPGQYKTHTKTTLEYREQTGALIMKKKSFDRPEFFQTAQRDYFDHYKFGLPPNAPPGKYELIVEVTDVPTGRKVKQKLEFHVRAN